MEKERISIIESLDIYGSIAYGICGRSMLPILRQGTDIVVIKKVTANQCKKNDVVLFVRDNGKYVLHRIRCVYNDCFYIIGDNCLYGEKVRSDQIIGKMIRFKYGNREVDVNDPAYLFYVRFWYFAFPVRKTVMLLRIAASKVYHALFK